MEIINYIINIFNDYTTLVISIGAGGLGLVSGMLGSYAVLKKNSLIGDAISHAALPGIAIAFIITGTKSTPILLAGALIAGLLAAIWVRGIVENTPIKTDSALGVVLSVFFGFGMMLLTYIQKLPNSNQAGLENFIFGQATTLMKDDIYVIAIMGGISVIAVLLMWKELKIAAFDPQFATSIGYNVRLIEGIVMTLTVVVIILGLQTVGVVLMSALIIAPATAARQWTDRLSRMIALAGIFGGLSGVIGTGISSAGTKIATGPTIILVAVGIVLISLFFAPNRGMIAGYLEKRRKGSKISFDKLMISIYIIIEKHENKFHKHSMELVKRSKNYTRRNYKELIDKGYIEVEGDEWSITQTGMEYAENLEYFKGGGLI